MKVQTILVAAGLAVGLSTGAFAATSTTATKPAAKAAMHHVVHHVAKKKAPLTDYQILWAQYAKATPKHKKDFWYASSQWWAAEGAKAYKAGFPNAAAFDLRVALEKIGQTPAV